MTRKRGVPWLLVALAALLALGMVLTLWAGMSGRVSSRHGVVGQGTREGWDDGLVRISSVCGGDVLDCVVAGPEPQVLGVAQLHGPIDVGVDATELVLSFGMIGLEC